MRIVRIISTAILGLLLFLFIAADLVVFGVVALDSAVVALLPMFGLVSGGVLGAVAFNMAHPNAAPSTIEAGAPPASTDVSGM